MESGLEPDHAFEFFNACVDLWTGDAGGAVEAKTFAAEGGDGATVDDRATKVLFNVAAGGGEVTEHCPHE